MLVVGITLVLGIAGAIVGDFLGKRGQISEMRKMGEEARVDPEQLRRVLTQLKKALKAVPLYPGVIRVYGSILPPVEIGNGASSGRQGLVIELRLGKFFIKKVAPFATEIDTLTFDYGAAYFY